MNLVLRFDIDPAEAEAFLADARVALEVLAVRPGYRSGWVGRSVDEPRCWTMVCEWEGVGAYRRALSAYDVKVHATALLARARDEPSAFEPLLVHDGAARTSRTSDRAAEASGDGRESGYPAR